MTEQEIYCYRKNKYLKEFILLYKSLPCLWKTKSKEYHIRELRTKAYKELIKKLREIDPTADRTSVVKKINSLRSSLRKEQRKVADLAKQGVIYEPRLWYYSLFDFLKDINVQGRSSVRGSRDHESEGESAETNVKLEGIQYNVEYVEDTYDDDDPLDSYDKYKDESSRDLISPLPKRAKISKPELAQTSSSTMFPERTSNVLHYDDTPSVSRGDQYDLFGKNVAAKLRDIAYKDNTQRLMAEKIINDALFIAELGKLEMSHCSKLRAE